MKDEKADKIKIAVIVTTAILVLMSLLPAMVSAQSDVKINEIMYNPSTEQGSDANMEWIELYNNDTEAVNISGWTIDNNPISENVMQSGDYVVLARNKTAFDAYYGALPCPVIDVTLGLKNDPGNTIVLGNSTGAEIDNVTYNASWGADGNGKTLERTATGTWAESIVDGGTPCKLKTFLNASDNNTTINVTTGEFLVITLEGNPTTGYTWEVTEPLDELVLQQVGDIVSVPESDLLGAPSKQIATFEVVGAGNTTIKMVYHRPWETEAELVDTFTLNVTAS
ncbi:hypothetical protein C4E22_03400 [ANME-1 cluster archaeon AG-394-G06]|nr:hypothetical protein [ANME-1 cluster archaeon AG-394-G06]